MRPTFTELRSLLSSTCSAQVETNQLHPSDYDQSFLLPSSSLKLKLQEQFTALPFGLMSLSSVCLLICIPQMNPCFNNDIFRDQQHSVAFNRPNPATYTLVPGKGVPKTNMTPSFAFPSHGVEFLFRCAVFSRSPSSPSKDR